MQILEILKTLQEQHFQILSKRQCSLSNAVICSGPISCYAHAVNLIKLLEIILLFLIMSILTSNAYQQCLLLITISLVIYIIITEFLHLKSLHEDLKVACSIPQEESSYCHTRLHLGFSAQLRILQVSACMMEPGLAL